MLTSDLCDYSDTYIVVKGIIRVTGTNANNKRKNIAFKNNGPLRSCISKINNAFIYNAEDLDIVMPMYNLLEHSDNYSMTSLNLGNYYRIDMNDDENENDNNNNKKNRVSNSKTITSKSFKYKTKIIGSTPDKGNRINKKVVVPLKHQIDFWRSSDLLLINCERELNLSWSVYCVISEVSRTSRGVPNTYPVAYQVTLQTTSANFRINNAKIYVPVATFSIKNTIKFQKI